MKMFPCSTNPKEDEKWTLTQVMFQFPLTQYSIFNCHFSWQQDGQLIHDRTGKCLDRGEHMSSADVAINTCSKIPSQLWKFDTYAN